VIDLRSGVIDLVTAFGSRHSQTLLQSQIFSSGTPPLLPGPYSPLFSIPQADRGCLLSQRKPLEAVANIAAMAKVEELDGHAASVRMRGGM